MKTIALKENNRIADTKELSALECLKSFHFGLRGRVVVAGMFKEGSSKDFSVLF